MLATALPILFSRQEDGTVTRQTTSGLEMEQGNGMGGGMGAGQEDKGQIGVRLSKTH